MNKNLSSLTIFAVVFALVFGLGAVNAAKASDSYNQSFIGEANLFGVDEADNKAGRLADRDRDVAQHSVEFDTYGLHGTLRP